ncbi:hypothetical protein HY988_00090 [Candidatus Micrarchaeota archaeon]|nr:hypothetical protein [Candidatus Micrarchaeota archaeon]
MFIFHFKPLAVEDKKKKVPYKVWTFELIKKEMPECPDKLAKKISTLPETERNSKVSALKEIKGYAGRKSDAVFAYFETDYIGINLFVRFTDKFVQIAKNLREATYEAFFALGNEKISRFFIKDPDKLIASFVGIAKIGGARAEAALSALGTDKIPELFVKDPLRVVQSFSAIARTAGNGTSAAFEALGNSKIADLFVLYFDGKLKFDQFVINVLSYKNVSIELGRPLDDLHGQQEKRERYMDSLSTAQVLGLLLSDPQYFHTSTNHMLFDRLKKDLKGRSVSELFQDHSVNTDLVRNFLFRAINYDRIYGRENSLLNEVDMTNLIGNMIKPLANSTFDPTYYFLLANALDKMKAPDKMQKILTEFFGILTERYKYLSKKITISEEERKIVAAIEFLLVKIESSTTLVLENNKKQMSELDAKAIFEPGRYSTAGKLSIIQIFDKNDTENHWKLSQQWFRKYGKPKRGVDGELIYEGKTARIILFMGESPGDNQKFVKAKLGENPNRTVTFRGHSFSLEKSFPYDIFGNGNGQIIFIPGSCGSSGSTAQYIANNPNTDLRFFSNTSTGRGQVTNAILDALIGTKTAAKFSDLLKKAEPQIAQNGGDLNTINVWSAGEALLAYVYRREG